MRIADLFRLGAASVRSRKRSTANTVLGIVFGLTLLIPVLFFTFAFHADLKGKVNSSRAISSVLLPFSEETAASNERGFALDASLLDEIASDSGTVDLVRARLFAFPSEKDGGFTLMHEGKTYGPTLLRTLPLREGYMANSSFTVKALDPRDGLVTEGTLSDMGATSVLIAGNSFSDGRGEVLLSEPLLRAFGYTDPALALGKTFTVFGSSSLSSGSSRGYRLDGDSDPDNEFFPASSRTVSAALMTEFEIVGVISEDYYLLNSLTYQDSHIWISEAAVTREDGTSFLPAMRRNLADPLALDLTYPEDVATLSQRAAEEEMFFPAIPAVRFSRCAAEEDFGLSHAAPVTEAYVECRDFDAASSLIGRYETECRTFLGQSGLMMQLVTGTDTGMVLVGFLNLRVLNTVSGYIVFTMLIFGGVVLLATLLNLFNSVNYSVQIRKNYMGMMQAIGAKRSLIPKMYFVEILLIFLIALPFAFLLAGGISYLMKFAVDAFFSAETGLAATELFTVAITLDMGWLALAIAIVLAFTALVAFLFSVIACRTVTGKGVIEVLATEQ